MYIYSENDTVILFKDFIKQGPQESQKLICYLKNHLKFKTPPPNWAFSLPQQSEMASLSNSRWQNREKRINRPTNNEDMVEKAKCEVVSESLISI